MHAFFFDINKRFTEQFPRILGGGNEQIEEGAGGTSERGTTLASKYHWFHLIEEMAQRDITKIDTITKTPAATVFLHLSYMIDYYNTQMNKLPS